VIRRIPAGRYALAFGAGAAAVAAFAPVGLYPLAIVALAVLVHLWARASPRTAFWCGFAFGLGLFGAGASWVYVSLAKFGGMPPALSALSTALFCALLALFPAIAGWLQARVCAGEWPRACLVVPGAWTVLEWLRSWFFTGFPWLSAGYAATGWPVAGYAPLAGVFGLSMLTVVLAGLLWLLARRQRPVLAGIVAAAILAGGEVLQRVEWSTPEGAPVSVALLQGNIEQELKFRPERYRGILDTYATLAEETRAQLIVLPETAIPRFFDQIDPTYLSRLAAAAERNGGDLLLGVPYRSHSAEYYNSVLTLGKARGQAYHKVHLVPFGEFIPPGFGFVLRWLQIPLSDFSRGAPTQPALRVAGQRVAINICYEDAFGDEIARRLPEATLLVNVSNVAWFGNSLAPAQHLQIARLRAIETARMHLAATNTGITAAIDRDGTVMARLPQFTPGRLEVAAQGYSGATPYVRYGDWPIILLALVALCTPAVVARRGATR
jgi:apolipoprotein N-acyltransferase